MVKIEEINSVSWMTWWGTDTHIQCGKKICKQNQFSREWNYIIVRGDNRIISTPGIHRNLGKGITLFTS